MSSKLSRKCQRSSGQTKPCGLSLFLFAVESVLDTSANMFRIQCPDSVLEFLPSAASFSGVRLGQRTAMSTADINQLKALYNCLSEPDMESECNLFVCRS